MATHADVRRIALGLPGAEEGAGEVLGFAVQNKGKAKGFLWTWKERVQPKAARVPNPKVIAVRVANLAQKDLLLAAEPIKFFTEPHYNGYPAILVRLDEVSVADLKILIPEAWRCLAPKELIQEFEGTDKTPSTRAATSVAKPVAKSRRISAKSAKSTGTTASAKKRR